MKEAFNQIQKVREHYLRNGGLHHAYLIEGGTKDTCVSIIDFLAENLGMARAGNPDLWSASFESFGIDDARDLSERASRAPFGERKVFIVQMQFITVQAQNALLKVLEEPTDNTHFFILMPNADILLPTVLSRLMRIREESTFRPAVDQRIHLFLAQDTSKRMAFLKNAPEIKDKGAAVVFINALERALYTKSVQAASLVECAQGFEEIALCRGYIYDSSASVKMLLEHLALLLPQVKELKE